MFQQQQGKKKTRIIIIIIINLFFFSFLYKMGGWTCVCVKVDRRRRFSYFSRVCVCVYVAVNHVEM